MIQVVDLEKDPQFQALDIPLVSVSTDPLSDLDAAVQKWKTTTPLLSDDGGRVTKTYGVPLVYGHGEPGHTFVLVGADGKVLWSLDYAIPENGSKMYVPPVQLVPEIAQHLPHA